MADCPDAVEDALSEVNLKVKKQIFEDDEEEARLEAVVKFPHFPKNVSCKIFFAETVTELHYGVGNVVNWAYHY